MQSLTLTQQAALRDGSRLLEEVQNVQDMLSASLDRLEALKTLQTELHTMLDIDRQVEELQGGHEAKEDIEDEIAILEPQLKKARKKYNDQDAQQL
jgi:predicted nuclease with TOPRIM domain